MPGASWAQTSFLGGEWSQAAQGRFSDPAYEIALDVCLNMIPIESGAVTRRPGTQFVGTTRSGLAGRLISFAFKQANPYSLEFTDGHVRFWSGPKLATTNDSVGVLAISTANPAVVQLASAVSWVNLDQAFFTGLGTSCPLLQNRIFSLTRIDGTHFSIVDAISAAPIDGSTLGVGFLAATAVLNRVLDSNTVYTGTSWQNLRSVQAEMETVLLNGTPPQVLRVISPPTTSTFATFNLSTANFLDGPYLDPITTGETITPSGLSGSVTLTASGTAFGGFVATDVGRLIRLFSEPALWNNTGLGYSVGNVVKYNGTYWTALKASASGDAGAFLSHPGVYPDEWALTPGSAVWAWAIITAFSSTSIVTATLQTALLYTVPIVTWRLGVYSNTTGWPTCGCYHEGRIWLAGAVDNRFDGSFSNGISGNTINFAPTDQFGNVTSAHAISYLLNASDVNPIFWMRSVAEGIACGTQAGEWLIQATSLNEPLTPTSIQAHRRTRIGCAFIEPADTEHTLVFVQAFKRKLLELFADVFSNKFTAPNLTRDAKHLSISGIAEIAYQRELAPIIWARRVDGALVGATYKRDTLMTSQGPNIIGWHRHTLGSGRVVESICVGPSPDGTIDALTMVTNDSATNVRHVEIMTNIWEEGNALSSAWYLDDAVTPSSMAINGTTLTLTINGLWHLNGKAVTAWVSGLDAGDYTVANGSIAVPLDGSANPLLSLIYNPGQVTISSPVVVGFTYNSDGQVLRPGPQKDSGAANGPAFGKVSRMHQIAVLLVDTVAGIAGTSAAGIAFGSFFTASMKWPALARFPNQQIYRADTLFSGVYWSPVENPYTFDEGQLCWRISRPYPATIAAIGAFQVTQDR